VLLGLVVETFVPEGGPLVVGIDETVEETRYGKKIAYTRVFTVIRFAQPTSISLRAAASDGCA
jgi:hypothetical protein